MKNLLILIFLLCSISAFGQVTVQTAKDGYLVYDFNGETFKSNKKIKKGTSIILIKEFPQHSSFFVISYKDNEYCINKNCIDKTGVDLYMKVKDENFKAIQHRKDSIRHREDSIRLANYRKSNDSIAQIKHEKDSVQNKIRRDSMTMQINFITSLLDGQKKWEQNMLKQGLPIEIIYITCSNPNSVGGVGLNFGFRNLSNKDIKYIYLNGYPINSVNDRCHCTVKGNSTTSVTGIGPIKYGEYSDFSWENTWYNHTIDKYIPVSISIQYMNGSRANINKQQINKLLTYELYESTILKKIKKEKIDLESLKTFIIEIGGYSELYKVLLKYCDDEFIYRMED